jgi:hypothetical protein
MARAKYRLLGWCTECKKPKLVYPAFQEGGITKDPVKAVRAVVDLGASYFGGSVGLCKEHRAMLRGNETLADKKKADAAAGIHHETWFDREKAKKARDAKKVG